MTPPRFVDRVDELDLLKSRFENDTAELVVIYGRRRLGKSALVREAIRGRQDAVYWQAAEETSDVQLANFVDTASETFPILDDIQRDWEALLRALGREEAVVVLDEFPYLAESDDALPSKIQRVWDMHLEETSMTLVLVGSSISIMEDKVLSGGSPLYGRRTAMIDLPPLDLMYAQQFYPDDDPDTVIQAWGVFGERRTISRHLLRLVRSPRTSSRTFSRNTASSTTNPSSCCERSSGFVNRRRTTRSSGRLRPASVQQTRSLTSPALTQTRLVRISRSSDGSDSLNAIFQ